MEESKPAKRFKVNDLVWILAAFMGFLALCFLMGSLLRYETKITVGDEKIEESFVLNIVGLLDGTKTQAWPWAALVSLIALGMVSSAFTPAFQKQRKALDVITMVSVFSYLLAICMMVAGKDLFSYYAKDFGMIKHFDGASMEWASSLVMICCAGGAVLALSNSSYAKENDIRSIAEDGMLIAAAFVLNFVKLPIATGAGSINFQMLPLMIIALRRGPLHGFVAGGLIYGLLTCITDGYGFFTYPFDYLIGFGAIGLMGFVRKLVFFEGAITGRKMAIGELSLALSALAATVVRFFGSTVSSMVFYGLKLTAAMAYNSVYIPVSGAIAIALIMLLYYPLLKLNRHFPPKRAL